jgi:tRNA-2-methylthio-N6-dimethylallyladenosine synthase
MIGGAKGERRRADLAVLKKRMPWVDEFLTYEELLQYLGKASGEETPEGLTAVSPFGWRESADAGGPQDPYLIPISQGCDNFCSYCVVPYTRGKEVSRSEEEILCEIKEAVRQGAGYIMLLGQNVNSYQLLPACPRQEKNELPFSKLLKLVHKIPSVKKISFLTLNPYDINDELIKTLSLPKIDRYIHLPVQSGDNEILKRMNRRYTPRGYRNIVKRMRSTIPNVEIGTDIIVGFPGETKKQFENSLKLVREMGFKKIFIGIYSEREGTAAVGMEDSVPLIEKKRRHAEVAKMWKSRR